MRIAVIGYGGVGKAFIKLLANKKQDLENQGINFTVNYILSSSGGIYDSKGIDCKEVIEFSNKENILANYHKGGSSELNFSKLIEKKDVDVLIELTPTNKDTGEPGMTYIKDALKKGINVITGNKGPILLAYNELNTLAKQHNVQLAVGCTVGGALPSINGGLIDMAGSEILSIEGILNGTTNFILKEMEDNNSTYKQALEKAQNLGIAETDPTLDVEGWDTASKILILTNVLMNQNKTLKDVDVEGITKLTIQDINNAKIEGQRYKLIGKSKKANGNIHLQVKLKKISSNDMLFNVDGKNKAIRYVSDTLGELVIFGGASGVTPAAASILRDLINIYRGYHFS